MDCQRRPAFALLCAVVLLPSTAPGQEVLPRRWGHVPTDGNFVGAGFGYTEGDISLDPVLDIEDGTVELWSTAAKYIRTFELAGKSARVELQGV